MTMYLYNYERTKKRFSQKVVCVFNILVRHIMMNKNDVGTGDQKSDRDKQIAP